MLRAASKSWPALGPYAFPVSMLFVGFALLTWMIGPLFNATLFLHPVGRHALSRRERFGAGAVCGCLAAAVLCFVSGALLGSVELGVSRLVLLSLCVPLSATFGEDNPRRRRILAVCTAALWATAVIGGALALAGGSAGRSAGGAAVAVVFLGVFAMSWLVGRWSLDPRTD
jgi:hypothetical protein